MEYSSTEDGTFAAVNPGSGTYTITLTTPAAAKTEITITPHEAGYWKVTASCAVAVTDPHNNQVWNGTLTTDVQDLTSAIVTFSPSPIVTGADKNNPGAVYTQAVATVAPAILANSVGVNKYVSLPGGTGDAQTGTTVVRDPSNGTITFDVGGKAGTNPSMPNGDLKLEATEGGTVLGTDLVIVEIPKAIGTPHPTFNGAVTPTTAALDASSVPAYFGTLPAGDVELVTEAMTPLTVTVDNQFGGPLGAEYNQHAVYENGESINVKIKNGQYSDEVGVLVANSRTSSGSLAERQWLAGAPMAIPSSSSTQDFSVEIAGFTLDPSVVGRKVNYNNGTLTVTWP